MPNQTILQGDCRDVLKTLDSEYVDIIRRRINGVQSQLEFYG